MSPLTINSELGADSNLHDMSSLASQCSKVQLAGRRPSIRVETLQFGHFFAWSTNIFKHLYRCVTV